MATESIASRVTSLADDYNPIHLETPKPQGRTGNMSQATINTASTTSAHAKSTVSIVSSSANEAAQAIISASNQQTGLTLIVHYNVLILALLVILYVPVYVGSTSLFSSAKYKTVQLPKSAADSNTASSASSWYVMVPVHCIDHAVRLNGHADHI